ncbi:hypothetical protein HON22_04575, partial [Candidatus Peregrinibacteria bacterium]|nr:hypothetical protein [Candidatus Peregrinibacteria bacterium]
IQSTNHTTLNVQYPLALNPTGGNVGIGVTSPETTLQVVSNEPEQTYFTSASRGIVVGGSPISSEGLALWHRGNGDDYIGSLADSGTSALHFVNRANSAANNVVAMTLQNGNVGIGITIPQSELHIKDSGEDGARIILEPQGTASGRLEVIGGDGHLGFITSNKNRLRILSNGNVGIGTPGPQSALHVEKDIPSSARIARFYDPNMSHTERTYLHIGNQDSNGKTGEISFTINNDLELSYMSLGVHGRPDAMQIYKNGNVNIQGQIHSGGSINANGTITAENAIYSKKSIVATENLIAKQKLFVDGNIIASGNVRNNCYWDTNDACRHTCNEGYFMAGFYQLGNNYECYETELYCCKL